MAITSRQRIAIAAILAAGLLGGAAVLMTERRGSAEAGHGESGEHAGHDEHGKDEHHGELPGKHADDHKDEHAEGKKDAHDGDDKEHDHAHKDDEKIAGKEAHEAHGDHDDDHDDLATPSRSGSSPTNAPASAPARSPQQVTAHAPGHDEVQRVTLSAAQIKAAGIVVAPVGPARLQAAAPFSGEIRFNEDRTAHVVPRLAGVVESVPANLGQRVRKGQVLAVLASSTLADQRSELLTARKRRDLAQAGYEREKALWEQKISAQQDFQQAQATLAEADIALQNATQKLAAVGATATGGSSGASLNRFEIRAPFDGTVVEKHLALGEAVGEGDNVFTVSDLGTVWAEFAVAPRDLASMRVGQKVVVSSTAFDSQVQGTVSYIGSLLGEQTRTARARVTVANPDGAWRLGLYVTVSLLGEGQDVAVAVGAEAVQTLEDGPSVFVADGTGFVARPVKVGRSDGKTVEVVSGLKAGERVASSNTFVLKSELGKASAEHSH